MNGFKKKILLIDDDRVLTSLVKMALEKIDFEVVIANDGAQGICQAIDQSPDLILLDLLLPKMNGYQVLRELKNNDRTRNIPIVYLSAQEGEAEKYWAAQMGANDYISKPFDIFNLIQRIHQQLEIPTAMNAS